MWIEVRVGLSYRSELIYASGLWDDATGLTGDAQLRLYHAVAEDSRTGAREHLLLNDRWLVDSRIPPRGLAPDSETDPVGDRYTLQADGTWPNFDTTVYHFSPRLDVEDPTPDSAHDFIDIRVRLLYMINTREYIDFLARANHSNDAGREVADIFASMGHAKPVELAHVLKRVPVRGLIGQPSTGETGTTGDSTDTTTGDSSDATPGSSGGGVDSGTNAGVEDEVVDPGFDDESDGNCALTL